MVSARAQVVPQQNDNLQNIDPQFVPMDSIENQKIIIGKSNGTNFEIKNNQNAKSKESNEEIKKNQNALILQGEKSNANQTQTNKDKDKARLIDSQNQSINLAVESVSLNSAREESAKSNGEIETQGEEIDDAVFDDARKLAKDWRCVLEYQYVKNKFGEVWRNAKGDAMNYSQYLLFLAQQPNKHRAKNGLLCAIKHIKKSYMGDYFDDLECINNYKSVSEQEYTRLLDVSIHAQDERQENYTANKGERK